MWKQRCSGCMCVYPVVDYSWLPGSVMHQGSSVIPPGMAEGRSGPASHNGLETGFTLSIAYFTSRKLGRMRLSGS